MALAKPLVVATSESTDDAVGVERPKITRWTRYDELPELLLPQEAADYLAIKKSLLYSRVRDGHIVVQRFGRIFRVPKTSLK